MGKKRAATSGEQQPQDDSPSDAMGLDTGLTHKRSSWASSPGSPDSVDALSTPSRTRQVDGNMANGNGNNGDEYYSVKNSKTLTSPPTAAENVSETLARQITAFKYDRGARLARQRSTRQIQRTPVNHYANMAPATTRLCIGGMTCNGCCTRIETYLLRQPGILTVNVSLLTSRASVTYDPSALTPQAITETIASLGFVSNLLPSESVVAILVHVGKTSPNRAFNALLKLPGVTSVVSLDKPQTRNKGPMSMWSMRKENVLSVEYNPEITGARTLLKQLSDELGTQVHASSPLPQEQQREQTEVVKFKRLVLWSFLLTLPVVVVTYILPLILKGPSSPLKHDLVYGLSYKDAVGLLCATPILVVVGRPIHESAFLAMRVGARVTMDVLISLSSITAYAFSYVVVFMQICQLTPQRTDTFFHVAALLISLVLLGRYIEKIVKARASNSVNALLQVQAKTAILLEQTGSPDGILKESYIDIILVERQDLLKVLPGARVPTDGVVVEGASTVDESMVTGESRNVAKEPGSVVIGGTINAHGVLIMRVTHTISESMLARIVHLVEDAQSSKSVNQNVADIVASYFTSFTIVLSMTMFVVWYQLAWTDRIPTHGWAPLPFALRFAISILVISCPCAISLAVPTATMVATSIGSQFGVLFKGGQALEALQYVDVIIFDKTGTLTTGELTVVDVCVPTGTETSRRKLWSFLASAEMNSEHSIGKALVAHAHRHHFPIIKAEDFESIPGCGVACTIAGLAVHVGSIKWMEEVLQIYVPAELIKVIEGYQKQGCVVVAMAIDNDLSAVVVMKNKPRPEAKLVVDLLKRRKIQTWIVTGDQRETALSIARSIGIPDFTVIADALPHQKVDKVRLLQSIGKNVAFVGDGVNDGPALAMADVGVAIGAGTDVAVGPADLVLVKDDLRDLLNAMDLSRATNRVIKWNITWGFIYNAVMMPLACGALYPFFGISIPPALAGLSELCSSVPVILFSLLLNVWRPPFHRQNDPDHIAIDVETTPLLVDRH